MSERSLNKSRRVVSSIKKNHMPSLPELKCPHKIQLNNHCGGFSLPDFKSTFLPFLKFLHQKYPVSPADGSHELKFRLAPWKGHSRIPVGCHMALVMKDCCHFSLGTTGGKSFWPPLSPSTEDSASRSCTPCFPKWKILSSQPLSADFKVFTYLSLTLIPNDEARSYLPKGKYHVIFCSHSQK